MPLNFLTLYKGYRAIPLSPLSPSSSGRSRSPDYSSGDNWGEANFLYDPAPKSPMATATGSGTSPSSSTICLPGTPRHGPLIDLYDEDEDSVLSEEQETSSRTMAEVRSTGLVTTDEVATALTYQEAALGRVAPRRGISHSGDYAVCDGDRRREELMRFYGVDEDAVEIMGELGVDERWEGVVVERMFDCDDDAGRSWCSGDRWRTMGGMAASPTEEKAPVGEAEEGNGGFVGSWLGLDTKLLSTGEVEPELQLPGNELLGLVGEEAAKWARCHAEMTDTGCDDESSNSSGSSS